MTAPVPEDATPSPSAKSIDQRGLSRTITNSKELVGTIKDIVGIVAVIGAALWTYTLTKQFRETVPKLSIKHDVASWELQDGSVLIRVETNLLNNGKVLIDGLKGKLIVQRLLPETDKQRDEYRQGKVFFDCTDKSERCISAAGLNLPPESTREFPIDNSDRTLEPGESESYWRYLLLDRAVRVVEVYTFIQNPEARPGMGGGGMSIPLTI